MTVPDLRSGYYIDHQDWPAGTTGNDPTTEEIFEVLDGLDPYYEGAIDSLAVEAGRG